MNEESGAERGEEWRGAIEREAERPEREDKSRLSSLDISLCLSWE